MEEKDEDDTCRMNKIDWDQTCYVPKPHLITEESFNRHAKTLSYRDYFLLFTSKSAADEKEDDEDVTNKNKDRDSEDFKIQNSRRSDIFETVSKEQVHFKNATTYHILSQMPSSKISNADRVFYHWYMKNTSEGKKAVLRHENQVKFKDLIGRIQLEQNEYQKFLHHASQISLKEYIYVKPVVKKEILDNIQSLIMKELENHEGSYSLLQTVNFDVNLLKKTKATLNFVRNVRPQTKRPLLNLPTLGTPITPTMNTYIEKKSIKKQVRISDEKMEEFCLAEDAGVYMTGSALLAIMESFIDTSREWLIPFQVKELTQGVSNARKVLKLCDPLPRRHISTRDINYVFYKQQVQAQFDASSITIIENATFVPNEPGESCSNKPADDGDSCINLLQCGDTNILIETNVDCYDSKSKQSYQVNPKIEFQPSVGFEQFALLDLCRAWWGSMIANTDCVLCPRIDVRNDCILRVDVYSRDVLCGPGCPYNPQFFFNHLKHLLSVLTNLNTPGNYLMEHAPGNSSFFLFCEKLNGFASLSSKYKDLINKKKDIILEPASPWLPIDTNILPNHYNQRREIPWIFPESKSVKVSGGRNKSTSRKGKKRKTNHVESNFQTGGASITDMRISTVIDEKKIKHYGGDLQDMDLF